MYFTVHYCLATGLKKDTMLVDALFLMNVRPWYAMLSLAYSIPLPWTFSKLISYAWRFITLLHMQWLSAIIKKKVLFFSLWKAKLNFKPVFFSSFFSDLQASLMKGKHFMISNKHSYLFLDIEKRKVKNPVKFAISFYHEQILCGRHSIWKSFLGLFLK